jgi:hypothetical protein
MVVKGTLTIVAICGLVLACTAPAASPARSSEPPSPTPTVAPTATGPATPASPSAAAQIAWTPMHLPATTGQVPLGGPAGASTRSPVEGSSTSSR